MTALAPLPVALPLLMAVLLVLLEKYPAKRLLLDSLSLCTAIAVLLCDLLLLRQSLHETIVYWFGGWRPWQGFPIGIAFVIDPASAGLACLSAFLGAMALLFSWHYFHAIGIFFHTLMLLFLASLQGFCLTGDLFNMFVFFELMGVSAYALTGYKIEDTGPLEGALNFSVMNSIGAFAILLGITMIYARTEGLNLAWVGASIRDNGADSAIKGAYVLLLIGFMIKAAIIPFHFWLPDAHAVAPTPASVLFSGIMVEVGLYAVARIHWTVFSTAISGEPLGTLLLSIGAATTIIGAAMAFIQRHLKRMLAFSTVSHAGMMLIGIALMTPGAMAGTLLYIAGHGCIKGALFVASGIILDHTGFIDEEDLRGTCRKFKGIACLYGISALALAGLPFFGTFAGKSLIEKATESQNDYWVTVFFVAASAITGAAVLRAGAAIFLDLGAANCFSAGAPCSVKESPEAARRRHTPPAMWMPMALLVAAGLLLGSMPQVTEIATVAGQRFTDIQGYHDAVLKGKTAMSSLSLLQGQLVQSGSIGTAMAGVLLAATLACGTLYSYRLAPPALNMLRAAVTPVLRLARRIHSGHIGDYVTWFMWGAAVIMMVVVI